MADLAPPLTPIIDTVTGSVTEIGRRYLRLLGSAVGALAPIDADYWVSRPHTSLSAERNLGALASGYLTISVAAGTATPSSVATIPAADLSGTIADARFPATLPAASGVNLTALNASSLATGTTAVARGGTGVGTLAAHGVVLGNGTGAVAVSGAGTAGQVLTSNGASADPTFQAVAGAVYGSVRCHAYGGAQSIPHATYTALLCANETVDVGAAHSTTVNTSRFTAPAAGDYRCVASTTFVANATGQRIVKLVKNGATDVPGGGAAMAAASATYGAVITTPTVIVTLAINDYLEAHVYQDSGGALTAGNGGPFVTSVLFERVG